ncbi:GumC family protein [Fulvimarina sp. 2208YS6-2-32]|uniref:GumC family protein n=1 Tax=Fulvimarina uroteuthidis TaxID=3098149 RepID=A0ABU5HXS6_9HYPH|nr:GumC family protein [Fulvimarina sp. 2208YS6-2-32]MDY8107944.1 GumC family protein [Fulvimarina sp. 2208YS6-2-32]
MFTAKPDPAANPSASSARPSQEPPEAFAGRALVDPLFLIGKLWRARYVILLCGLIGAGLATAVALVTPKLYEATTQILVDPRDIKVVQNEVTPNGLPSDATLALIESQTAVIHSNEVLLSVIRQADLLNDPDYNGTGFSILGSVKDFLGLTEKATASPEGAPLSRIELVTLRNFREHMKVFREPKSFVLHLSVRSTSAQKSAQLANLLGQAFIAELGEVQSTTARRASDALSGRLEELKESVGRAERAVEEYKVENRLVGVGGRLVDDDYILRINDQLARSRGEVTALRNTAEQMRSASVDDVVEGSFPEELTSEALNRLRTNYAELSQQQAVLAASLGERHPRMIANAQALEAARTAIRAEVGRIVAATQTELSRAESTDGDLTGQIDRLKTKQLETSGSFVKLRELEREVEASRAIYEAFLLRARETGEQEMLNTANVRVISAATAPLDPASMSRRNMVLIGFLAGLIVGLGLATIWALWGPVKRAMAQNRAGYARRDDEELQKAAHDYRIAARSTSSAGFGALRQSDTRLPDRIGAQGQGYGERVLPTGGYETGNASAPPHADDAAGYALAMRAGSDHRPDQRTQRAEVSADARDAAREDAGARDTMPAARRKWRLPPATALPAEQPAAAEGAAGKPRARSLSEAVTALRQERRESGETGSRTGPSSAQEAREMQAEIEAIKARLMGLRTAVGVDGDEASRHSRETTNA